MRILIDNVQLALFPKTILTKSTSDYSSELKEQNYFDGNSFSYKAPDGFPPEIIRFSIKSNDKSKELVYSPVKISVFIKNTDDSSTFNLKSINVEEIINSFFDAIFDEILIKRVGLIVTYVIISDPIPILNTIILNKINESKLKNFDFNLHKMENAPFHNQDLNTHIKIASGIKTFASNNEIVKALIFQHDLNTQENEQLDFNKLKLKKFLEDAVKANIADTDLNSIIPNAN